MSLKVSDEFLNKYGYTKKKRKEDEEDGLYVSDEFLSTLNKHDDDIAPVPQYVMRKREEILNWSKSQKEKEMAQESAKWYNSGLFEDGWDFGDVTKTILGIDTKKKEAKVIEDPEPEISIEELKKKKDTEEDTGERLRYTQLYNQKTLAQYSDIFSKTKMDGQNHTILEEINLLANMESGEEKDKRKEAILAKFDELGLDRSFYAHFAGDGEFDWGTFGKWIQSAMAAGLNSFNKGVFDTADVLLGNPLKALGWENNPISQGADYYGDLYSNYRYNANLYAEKLGGDGWNFATDAVEGTLGAVPNALLMFMTGGASTASSASSLANNAAMQTGNILTKAGLTVESMLKNPQYWMSFARTLGSDYKEAKEMGVSDVAASVGSVLKSLVNSGIEIGLDGGSGIQGLQSGLKEGGKPFWEWVESSIEEGGEEILQKFVGEAVDKLGYGSDKEMFNPIEYAKEGALGIISGMALGGGQMAVQGTANAVAEHKANKLTDFEQAVKDKLVEKRIAEKETDGKTLSKKEKADIEEDVDRKLRKGYISAEEIEEVLGGEKYDAFRTAKDDFFNSDDYKAYQKAVEAEEKAKEEFEPLVKMVTEKMTGEQIYRRDELKKILDESKVGELKAKVDASAKNVIGLRNQMRSEMMARVKDTRLAESYRELIRSKQKFTVDVNQYKNEYARKTVQSIIDSGLGDNSNQFHETVEWLAQISADKNVTFNLTDNAGIIKDGHFKKGYFVNGYVNDNGDIVLNKESPTALNTTVGHEITHVLKKTDPKGFEVLQKAVLEYAATKEGKAKFDARLAEAREAYQGKKNTTAEEEVTADIIGEYLFTDYDFVHSLSVSDRNVFQKVYDEIKYLVKIATAGSKEARELEKVKKMFDKAWRETGNGKEVDTDEQTEQQIEAEVEVEGNEKYSIRKDIVDINGKEYDSVVELDKTVGRSVLSNPQRFLGYIEKNLVGLQMTVEDASGNIEVIEFARPNETTSKNGKRHPVLGELAYTRGDTRKQVIVNAQEVVEESSYDPVYSSKNSEHGWLDENGWESRKTYVLAQDGNVYEAYLKIAKTRDGRNILYAVNLDINNGIAVDKGATQKRAAVLAAMPSGETVTQEDQNVKYSIRKEDPPKETGVAYKVFFAKDGKLYPPMVANPDGADTPMGVWLNADVGVAAPPSKTGRAQVRAGGKGTQGGSGSLAFRPGWHLGDLPRASQFDRVNPETGKKELFPENFVWAEVEYAKDVDYQEEAMSYGYTDNGKFRHAYAGLPRLPENGYYRYRTNPNPDTVPWVITGAMKVNRLLSDAEVNEILVKNGVEPVHRQGGDVGLDKFGFDESGNAISSVIAPVHYSMTKAEKDKMDSDYMDAVNSGNDEVLEHLVREYAKASMPESKLVDENGNLRKVYHGTNTGDFTVFNPDYIGMSSGDDGFFGMGFYFAYSKGEAAYYGAERIIPAYLDLRNPFNFDKELQTYNGEKARYGHAPDAVALMNFADKFPDIAMSITIGAVKNGESTGKSISVFEFAKAFKDVIENKEFEYQELVNEYGETELLVTADPQVHEYEYNGETHSYRDYGFQKRWLGEANKLDVAYEYLSNAVYSYLDIPRRTRVILDNNREFTDELKRRGYDGAIQSEYGDEAVAFYPSQIKSAQLVTKDDEGNVIPLSERFDRSNDDIRYSMTKVNELENAYQYDLDNEDMLGAEMVVEEMANLAMPDSKIRGKDGRLIPVYHGTNADFWEFDTSADGGKNGTAEGFGIYLSDDTEVTEIYGDRQIKMFANITKPATSFKKTINKSTLIKLIKDTCVKQAQKMVEEEGYDSLQDALRDTWISNYVMTYDMSMEQAYREIATSFLQQNDNDKDLIHEVMFGMAIRNYDQAMDFYRNSLTPVTGIDGFITKWTNSSTGKTSNIYLAFDSSQLKSADAVTKDDHGNVIPLAERFNFANKDIRYHMTKEGAEPNRHGNWHIDGRDFGVNDPLDEFAPVREDVAPVQETTVSNTESVAPEVAVSKTENVAPYEDNWKDSFDAITDADAPPVKETAPVKEISTVAEKIKQKIDNAQAELDNNRRLREQSFKDYEEEIASLQAEYEAKKNKNSLVAQGILRRIERLKRLQADNNANYAKRISDLEARVEKLHSKEYSRAEHRRAKQEEYTKLWEDMIGNTSTWKDMPIGLQYKTKTLRRILRKVVKDDFGNPDFRKADEIYDELETKYDHNEALLKRESQRMKEVFQKLNLNHAEDTYAHMLGEFRHNPQTELTEDMVKEYYDAHKKHIDIDKVNEAIEESRKTFDELIGRVNKVLKEQGFKEIPYRKGYFPHFTNPKQNWLQKLLNWKPVDTEIPTSIAGLTETFKPQRSWQKFDKQRQGDKTDYSLYQGLDTYIHGALDWIYHIEDLQKRRALENHIRYVHSEEGIKQRIKEIKAENYDADEAQQMIDSVLKEANNPLSGLVRELMNRTNTLANKKSSMDRGMEDATNRKIYSTMTNLNNRINANMVVGSMSSALTNFIPMVQSWHQVSPVYTVRGLGDFVRSVIKDDGVVAKSDYLTNRLLDEEKLYQTGWDKVSDKAAFMMNAVDNITSQTVWRSKYLQNIHEGMSESAAIKDADQFAKNLMAGRSRGNAPTIFDAKNPLIKIATAFQLEVANQYGYMFEDVPQDSTSKARLVKGYATAFIGAYLYNALYSSLVGRDAAFDPIGIIEDLLKGLFDDDDEPEDVLMDFGKNVIEEVPFVGGLIGGGRIPMSSALPYGSDSNPFQSMLTDVTEGNWDSFGKELLKPLYYLAMPVGGGQIKKSVEGLGMFLGDHPVSGSYTDSGKLRFPVEPTFGNVVQAGLFGQYASNNARDYFDNERSPLGEKQIQEYMDSDLPIADYWNYRDGLKGLTKLEEKMDYIDSLDLPVATKNLFVNNIADRKKDIDMETYSEYDSLEEFDFAQKNPSKYKFLTEELGVTYQKYSNCVKPIKDAYDWAFDNPEAYTVSKAISDNYLRYYQYKDEMSNLNAKDANGNSVSGLKKQRVIEYINGLDIDYGQKIILYRSMYDSKADQAAYNADIVEYLNSRDDISREEMIIILKKLGFTVSEDGTTVTW